jgi:hypothetical protein
LVFAALQFKVGTNQALDQTLAALAVFKCATRVGVNSASYDGLPRPYQID